MGRKRLAGEASMRRTVLYLDVACESYFWTLDHSTRYDHLVSSIFRTLTMRLLAVVTKQKR